MDYYACFSVAVAPLATDAINAFVVAMAGKAEITAGLTTVAFRHLNSRWLDQFQFGEGQFWVIHGARLSKYEEGASSAKLFAVRSRAATCDFIDRLASEYEWCFFLWGGHSSVRLVAMLSNNANLQSKYLAGLGEISQLRGDSFFPVVTKYKVAAGSCKSFRSALLCKPPDAEAIWRTFPIDRLLIVFVSPEAFEWHTDKSIEQPGWVEEFYVKKFPVLPNVPLGKWIYEPRDARGVEAVLNLRGREPAVLLPASLGENLIRGLTERLFSAQSNYVIPAVANSVLDRGWIYLSKVGHPDDDYSLFAAADAETTAKIVGCFGDSDSPLVALF